MIDWQRIETGTEAGLAGGTWLPDGRAVIVGADGVILILDDRLESANRFHTEDGWPLSSVIALPDGRLVTVGLQEFGNRHPVTCQRTPVAFKADLVLIEAGH